MTWPIPLVASNILFLCFSVCQMLTEFFFSVLLCILCSACLLYQNGQFFSSVWDFFIQFINNIFYNFAMKFFSIWTHPYPGAWESWPQSSPLARGEWSQLPRLTNSFTIQVYILGFEMKYLNKDICQTC